MLSYLCYPYTFSLCRFFLCTDHIQEMKKKRAEVTVEIRKNKREETLQKRRNVPVTEDTTGTFYIVSNVHYTQTFSISLLCMYVGIF